MKTIFFKRKVSCDIWFPPDKLILGYAQHQEMDVLPVFKKWMFYPSSIILGDADVHDQPTSSVSAHGPASAIQEHQRVFNYMQPRSRGFNPRRNSASSKKGKSKLQSCTLKFFCLAKVNSEKPPSSVSEKTGLSNCGLGPGSITIDLNSSAGEVHRNLVERFPLLQAGGGYELLLYQRGGSEQGFHNIPPPYTPARIKELAGQAHVYVQPLQQDLDDIDENEPNWTTAKVSESSSPGIKFADMKL